MDLNRRTGQSLYYKYISTRHHSDDNFDNKMTDNDDKYNDDNDDDDDADYEGWGRWEAKGGDGARLGMFQLTLIVQF